MAETNRRTRALAERMGLPRPSYERVRQHLTESRRVKARQREKAEIVLGVAMYTRPVAHLSKLHD
jgi:hypothetical protein